MPYTTQTSDFWGWYLRHNNRVVWKHLQDAGIDVFASGPSNNPQLFLDLTNVMPAMNEGFSRRWGTNKTPYNSASAVAPFRTFIYSSPQDSSNSGTTADTNLWLMTDGSGFSITNDSGALTSTSQQPQAFYNTTTGDPWAVTSREWFYYGNGIEPPRKVQLNNTSSTNTDSLMGIVLPGFSSNSTRLIDYPCALLSTDSSYIYLTGTSGTVYPASSGYGYTTAPSVSIADPTGSGSGAAVSTIIGVHGEVIGYTVTSPGSNYQQATATVAAPPAGGTQAYLTLYVQTNSSAPRYGQVVGADLGGPMQFVKGRQYTVALQNSSTGHTSDANITNLSYSQITGQTLSELTNAYSSTSGATATNIPIFSQSFLVNTGFTQNELVISVPASTLDSQVDTILLLATSDGGSTSTLYQVTTIPLSSFTLVNGYYQYYYVDTLPDSYTDTSTWPSSGGSVSAPSYSTNLTFNTSQYEYNTGTSRGSCLRTKGSIGPGTLTDYISAYGFGLSVPVGATIRGVQATVSWQGQASGTGVIEDAALFYLGSPIGIVKTPSIANVTTLVTNTLGSESDLWGATLTPAIVNSSSFGFGTQIQTVESSGTDRSFLFTWTITVYYSTTSGGTSSGSTLLESDIWAYTDSFGNSFGILLNTPPTPPGFLYPTLHQGRMFATDGKTVFYSKSLDEVTTSTGLITSKWEECWPADYQLPIALNNEKITGIKSDGTNLHIGTNQSIFTVFGSDPSNFDVPSVSFAQTGVLSNDCWTVIYKEGIPAGFVWITPDYKILYSDFSTYRDIGTPIYPKLFSIDSSKLQFNKVLSLTQGPYNFLILQLFTTSGAVQPEYFIWETTLQKWYRWVLSSTEIDGVNVTACSAFVYEYPGYTTSSYTPGSRYLFFWKHATLTFTRACYFDPAQSSDQLIIPIPWNVRTSWQDFGDPTAIKVINEIELVGGDSPFTVSLYGATSQAQFDSGGTLLKTGNSVTGPIAALGTQKFFCAGVSTAAKYYSIQISSANPGTNPSVLNSFSAEYYPMARI